MVEAQEMFRMSNKVTRPEKALILGFMAGSRGNVVLSLFSGHPHCNNCPQSRQPLVVFTN